MKLIRLVAGDVIDSSEFNKAGIYSHRDYIDLYSVVEFDRFRHPGPKDEKWEDSSGNKYHFKIDPDKHLFAFNSLEQMFKWFCYDELKSLEVLRGFEYILLESDEYYFSKTQSIFNKHSSKVIARFEKLEHLLEHLKAGTNQTMQSNKINIEILKWFSVEECRKHKNKIYVFGDNMCGFGKGGQAIIRDEPNAYGIVTKAYPSNSEKSYLNDSMFTETIIRIESDIQKIKDVSKNKIVVFPKDGLGTGLAKLPEKAPETYEYLVRRLKEEFNYINGV